MRIKRTIAYILIVLLYYSCINKQNEIVFKSSSELSDTLIIDTHKVPFIHTFTPRDYMSPFIKGRLSVLPGAYAEVYPPNECQISKIWVKEGDNVKKGSILATIQHRTILELKQDYLETLTQFNYYKSEFARQGELSIENAASIKKMENAENDFLKTEIKLNSTKKQLELLGIDANELNVDNISGSLIIKSPINGKVKSIDAKIGKYFSEDKSLFEIIDPNALRLELSELPKPFLFKKGSHFQILNYREQIMRVDKKTAIVNSVEWEKDSSKIILHVNMIEGLHEITLPSAVSIVEKDKKTNLHYVMVPNKSLFQQGDRFFLFGLFDGNKMKKITVSKIHLKLPDASKIEVDTPINNMLIVANPEVILRSLE